MKQDLENHTDLTEEGLCSQDLCTQQLLNQFFIDHNQPTSEKLGMLLLPC